MGDFALIGLGSNLGDREATLDRALVALDAATGVGVRALSAYHATAPVGGPGGQGAFLNAAARLETNLKPAALHRLLREIEHRAGRTRDVRWGARTLDLDLILFGDRVIDTPELSVPHPRMGVRRFVLAPMAEVAPDAVDPMTGRTIRELLRNLDRRPGHLTIDTHPSSALSAVAARVADSLGADWIVSDVCPPIDQFRRRTRRNPEDHVSIQWPTFFVLQDWDGPRSSWAGAIASPIVVPESIAPEAIAAEILDDCAACRC